MKNKKQFDNSIKVLVKAYMKGELMHIEPCACAVGNLIADGMGYVIKKTNQNADWFYKNKPVKYSFWYSLITRPSWEVLVEFNSTGYTTEEIVHIEQAFESVLDDSNGYKGLCAVFDVLVQVHKGNDKQLKLAKDKLLKI